MARTSNPKVPKTNFLPDKNYFLHCKLKIQWPTFRYRKDETCLTVLNRLKQERRSEINRQKFLDLISKEKKVYCSHEDPLKKAETNRRRMLQKIKRVYRINLDGLNEHIVNEIILKVNLLEKQKREREKRNAEKNSIMMKRLIDEQKYKRRVKKQTFPPRQKKTKFLPCIDEPHSEKEERSFEGESGEKDMEHLSNDLEETKDKFEEEEIQKKSISTCGRISIEPRAPSIIRSDMSYMGEGEEIDFKVLPKTAKCVLREKGLSATPEKIVFENYLKDKIYLQDLKITNLGTESVHCRYLGIAIHTEGEDKFPIGVAVRDSALLRPGLWCSTKIRLCAPDDTKHLECSIVYETRRKANPFQHAWFLVPVICLPCKANVKITPLRIIFPSLTWYEANKTEKKKLFKKFIKLENTGAKSCSCKIVKERKTVSEYGEIDEFQSEENFKEEMLEVKESSRKTLNGEEDDSEGYRTLSYLEGVNNACLLLDEIFDNIFATFRFVPKYHIELPPQSTKFVEVKFTPEYKGFHHDIYYIQFEDYDVVEQSIELIGNIKSLPIKPEPTVIDLKICTLNSGVYVSSFKVFNDNPTSFTVAIKIPLALRNHCHVSPSSITILGRDFREFFVTFYPRVNLKEEAKKFYKADLGLLEFPLYIHPASISACKHDFIKIYVFAVITDYILELSPPFIDFGTVTTLETVSTKIQLTNHSLAAQEFGFLNLPKDVAVEPNMGFGMILPRETITLDLLFSPQPGIYECDYKEENRAFEIEITSIAEYGGFGEIYESERESVPVESSWIGESLLKTSTENTEGLGEEEEEEKKVQEIEESEEGIGVEENGEFKSESEFEEEKCEDDSSIDDVELFTMLHKEEIRIRNFLKEDREAPSDHSFFGKIGFGTAKEEFKPEVEEQVVEYRENDSLKEKIFFRESFRSGMNSIKCKAHVIKPVCQLSETVIQLPATPYTSFSLYRFHIIGSNLSSNTCVCGRTKKSCEGNLSFEAAFEFTHSSPHIKLEPRSGYLRAGETIPITIVFRPEFEAEHLVHEARIQKAKDMLSEKYEKKLSLSKPETSKGKTKPSQPSAKKGGQRESDRVEQIINVNTLELENNDFFAGQKALLEFVGSSYSEVPVHCVVKVKGCDGRETTEYHDLIFICPIIKPKFKYVGLSQEINFGRVLVHTCVHYVLEVQNISLERIQPEMSLLNPIGPFSCLGGLVKRDVDPEHIWRLVITYTPVRARGVEKEFFEIKCGSTTIFLTVSGESYTPEIKHDENERKKASFAKERFIKDKSALGIDENRSKSSKVGIIDRGKKGKTDKSREEIRSIKSEVIKSLQFGDVK